MAKVAVVQSAVGILNTTGTNVTTSAFVDLMTAANMKYAASQVVLSNSGSQALGLYTGAAGSEVFTGIIIPPTAVLPLVPLVVQAGVRLSLKSLSGASQTAGFVVISFFDLW